MARLTEEEIEQQKAAGRLRKREEVFEETRARMTDLLDSIGAGTLVVVDDEVFSVAVVLQAAELDQEPFVELIDDDFDSVDEEAEWRGTIEKRFAEAAEEKRAAWFRHAQELLATERPQRTPQPLEVLARIVPADRLLLVTPHRWDSDREELLAGGGSPHVVLFDQELGDDFDRDGLQLLSEYRKAVPDGGRAGILSAKVNADGLLTTLTDEQAETMEFGKLLLIGKEHLTPTKADLRKAIDLFRLTANLPDLLAAREEVLHGLLRDAETAAKRARDMAPRVLEDLVYRSSYLEGAWEGETMARMAALYLLEATQIRGTTTEFQQAILRARDLTRLQTDADERSLRVGEELSTIENYALAEWVNGLRLPLSNGDVFQRTDRSGSVYVLVAQPCDLVIRSDGTRKLEDVRLLEIDPQATSRESAFTHRLPDGPPSPLPGEGGIRLTGGPTIKLDVLDLAWSNTDGLTELTDVGQPLEPLPLTEGMRLLMQRLRDQAAHALTTLAKLTEDEDLRALLIGQFGSGGVPLHYDGDHEGRWQFPLQRVGRLTARQADALLVRHHVAESRAAFDHPLTGFGAS